MAVVGYELLTVQGDYITVDLLCWRRYRCRCTGIFEKTLDANPHLSVLHRTSPFLPVGTQVRLPIDPDILRGAPQAKTTVEIWKPTRGSST